MRRKFGPEIERLIQLLAKLPGLGSRSARRVALHCIQNRENLLAPLGAALEAAYAHIRICSLCGNADTSDPCGLCSDPDRDQNMICVVEEIGDLWALERAYAWNGFYHVLGGTLSALEGIRPEDLSIFPLIERVKNSEISEVVLALNATVGGQTTAHYIMAQLKPLNIIVSRLAHGVPVGGELDYLDDGTLTAAMRARRPL